MRRAGTVLVLGWLAAAACSDEDRKAWVSILPIGESSEADSMPGGPRVFALSRDSTAVLLGTDTLFMLDRLPARGPGGAPLAARRFGRLTVSPDSLLVGFTTIGDGTAVGFWSRPQQLVSIAERFAAGADTLAWSPDSRWLGYQGRAGGSLQRVGVYDARIGRRVEHPVLTWLGETGRSVTLQGWVNAGGLRVLVAPGAEPRGGLAYVWQAEGRTFIAESHVAPLAERAPAGARLEPGGVWSLDLGGDGAPETVALYRTADGAPAALVLESAGAGWRVGRTEPLITLEALGLESWERAGAVALELVVALGGRTTLLLRLPSPEPPLRALGLFQAAGGELQPVLATTPEGPRPAVFLDGRSGDGTVQLGLVDLDEDGSREVVSATGQLAANALEPSVSWRVAVFRWAGDRLAPAPELAGRALERIARASGGAAGPDSVAAAPGRAGGAP